MNPIDFRKYLVGDEAVSEAAKSVRALKTGVSALAKGVEEDGKRIEAGLQRVKDAAREISEKLPRLQFANEDDRKALLALGSSLEALKKQGQDLKKDEEARARTQKQLAESTGFYTKELKAQRDALKAAYDSGSVEGIKTAAKNIQALKQDAEQLTKAVRGSASVFSAATGSYNEANQRLQSLRAEYRALGDNLGAANPKAAELRREIQLLDSELRIQDKIIGQTYRNVGNYTASIIEAVQALEKEKAVLLQASSALRTQANATGLSAEAQEKLQQEIKQTDRALGEVNGQLKGYGISADQGGANTASFAAKALALYGVLMQLKQAGEQVFRSNVQYSDQLADVRKTTGLSADEAERLADSLKQIPTRTSLTGLLDIAKVGGQIGIAKDQIEGFTKSVDVAVQALGDDFQGGAEQIATELGKISNVFKADLGPDVAQNLLAIGSAVNEIGAEGAATAPFLTTVALKVGQTSAAYGVGLKNVLAYAAVLEESGTQADVAGSSLNRLFSTIAGKTEASFKIAALGDSNLTLKQFTKLVNTDFNGAIQAFLKGLNAGGTSTTRLNSLLETLKLESGEAKSTILSLAQNTDLFAERQAVANQQLTNATSLAAEAEIKNQNLAGSWEQLKNVILASVTSGAVGNFFKSIIDGANQLLRAGDNGKLQAANLNSIRSSGELALANQRTANSAKDLLATYDELTGQMEQLQDRGQKPTIAQKQQLQTVTLKLRDALGENIGKINAETGAFELNAEAVREAIKQRLLLSNQEASGLALRLSNLDAEKKKQENNIVRLREETAIRERALAVIGRTKQDTEFLLKQQLEGKRIGPGYSPKEIESISLFGKNQRELAQEQQKLFDTEAQRRLILQQLNELGFKASDVAKLFSGAQKEAAKASSDLGDELDDEKKKLADVARAQFELNKARLEGRIADFDRQAGNVANSEAVRTSALQKAAADRIALAELETTETIRQAVAANKDLVGGDQVVALTRTRLAEEFGRKKLEIGRTSDKALIALHNELLNALGEVDKLVLESEIETLDRIADNENNGAAVRQQALLDAAARRLEIIELEGLAKIRAAQGNAAELLRIEKELEVKRAAVLNAPGKGTAFKLSDADKANLDEQLKIEGKRTAARVFGLDFERQYQKELFDSEQNRLKERLAILQQDPERVREARELELEIERNANNRSLEMEREKAREREAIIQESFAAIDTIGGAFFQLRSDRLQEESRLIRRQYDLELEGAGDNEALKAQVQENFRQKELANRRKQAKAEKQQALFSIALNTAQAVLAVNSTGGGTYFADFGISAAILTALVLAQGAAQAAVVASRPLPAFFKGTDNAPEGPAWVAERGPELIGRKRGGYEYVAEKGIAYLEAGDKVFTADKTTAILQAAAKADALQHGALATQHSFNASTAAINGTSATRVAGGSNIEKALQSQTAQILRGLDRNAERTAEEIMRRRLKMGNSSLDDLVNARQAQQRRGPY
ncbi:phage tail tape measure protein [Hymenobacter koreensis]|uniref:Phage tail tape measure protein domain-containing protein n=1 Tax=Hymenobacter koreensis TaxID=1084523 RepID=A0ABP8JP23_9BACT